MIESNNFEDIQIIFSKLSIQDRAFMNIPEDEKIYKNFDNVIFRLICFTDESKSSGGFIELYIMKTGLMIPCIAVTEDARGSGIADYLMSKLLEWVRCNFACYLLEWEVSENNVKSMKLAEKFGFVFDHQEITDYYTTNYLYLSS